MENKNTRKWFVYMGDHHEGPFSIPEIQAKMMQRLIGSDHHVWCEGMADWKTMRELDEFSDAIAMAMEGLTGTGLSSTMTYTQTASAVERDFQQEFRDEMGGMPDETLRLGEEPSGLGRAPEDEGMSLSPDDELLSNPLEPSQSFSESSELSEDELREAGFETGEFEAGAGTAQQAKIFGGQKEIDIGFEESDLYEDATGMGLTPEEKAKQEKLKRELAKQQAEESKRRVQEAKMLGLTGEDDFAGEQSFQRSRRRKYVLLVLLLLIGVLGYFGQLKFVTQTDFFRDISQQVRDLSKTVPLLAEYVSPLPPIEGLSEPDRNDLTKALSADLLKDKALVDVAIASPNSSQPKVYLTSNLPDGAKFTLIIKGRPGTLLNRSSFQREYQLSLQDNLASLAEPLRQEGGEAIPQGEYDIIIFESAAQPDPVHNALSLLSPIQGSTEAHKLLPEGRKLLVAKRYFLGGLKDSRYEDRLAQWKQQNVTQAKTELRELRNFVDLVKGEHGESSKKFDYVFGFHRNPKTRDAWTTFAQKSAKIRTDLKSRLSRWNTENFMYPDLYAQLKKSGLSYLDLFEQYSDYLQVIERDSLENRKKIKAVIDEQRKSLSGDLEKLNQELSKEKKSVGEG